VLPQFFFGFLSVFSGQQIFEPWIYQMYNISFTAFPIMWFALFDFEKGKKFLLDNPFMYKIGLNNECFSIGIFWQWVVFGALHALLLLFFTFFSLEGRGSVTPDGQQSSLWLSGTVTYSGVVILANITLL
jgi:magnesium-transporting ATPase (P-type)